MTNKLPEKLAPGYYWYNTDDYPPTMVEVFAMSDTATNQVVEIDGKMQHVRDAPGQYMGPITYEGAVADEALFDLVLRLREKLGVPDADSLEATVDDLKERIERMEAELAESTHYHAD